MFKFRVNLTNKKGYLVSLYRSPNQNPNEFELLLTNLVNLLDDITRYSFYVTVRRF